MFTIFKINKGEKKGRKSKQENEYQKLNQLEAGRTKHKLNFSATTRQSNNKKEIFYLKEIHNASMPVTEICELRSIRGFSLAAVSEESPEMMDHLLFDSTTMAKYQY